METFIGYIKSPQDALLIFEACRQGQLNRVQRRLSSKERFHIQSGSVFAWDENEAGMRRWTDGKTWSPSRVLGSFLTYRELDTKRRPRRPQTAASSSPSSSPSPSPSSQHHHHHHHHHNNKMTSHSMCSYKQDGLVKQSFSICTGENQKLHLISYYNKKDVLSGRLQQPTLDPILSKISIPKGLYPIMNPLDTSGGHSATLHNLRQQSYQEGNYEDQEAESDDDDVPADHHIHSSSSSSSSSSSASSSSYSSPPSLSSSPFTSDEDINMDLLPSPAYSPFPPPPSTSSQQHAYLPSSLLLPTQEIAWEKMPSSEDQRQLQAIQGLLRL
ncbi:Gti1/Pac2 family-domain-containing protein [Absidia repens]|uniref:Gti1/Pac2 family-domain-containing protein n=1 Tax=Absidia repens TaxID=90262 RepID=A0A1X2I7H5_9FUNG|nr:Gti1/Pac2 family-domain-containing protein [Absidia repens]